MNRREKRAMIGEYVRMRFIQDLIEDGRVKVGRLSRFYKIEKGKEYSFGAECSITPVIGRGMPKWIGDYLLDLHCKGYWTPFERYFTFSIEKAWIRAALKGEVKGVSVDFVNRAILDRLTAQNLYSVKKWMNSSSAYNIIGRKRGLYEED